MTAVTRLPEVTLRRGSDQRISLPSTASIEGVAVDFEVAGYLMLQYREPDGSGPPTRWKSSDGAARYDSTANAFLVPDDDAILSGSGTTLYDYDIYYIDGDGDPKIVGESGRIKVIDARTGVSGV